MAQNLIPSGSEPGTLDTSGSEPGTLIPSGSELGTLDALVLQSPLHLQQSTSQQLKAILQQMLKVFQGSPYSMLAWCPAALLVHARATNLLFFCIAAV